MDKLLQEALGYSYIKTTNIRGGGCINDGHAFDTDKGTIFVKFNSKSEARRMFDGEYEGLNSISNTNTIQVPKPLKVLDNPKGGSLIVMEYKKMDHLSDSAQLGKDLANLHLSNFKLINRDDDDGSINKSGNIINPVKEFGYHITTCCGYLPQENSWNSDWITFFSSQRLEPQIRMVEENYGDREIRSLWSQLQNIIPSFFKDIQIYPSLLHGDLWNGNVAEADNKPIIFDPASFYGHHEYEFGISKMFGGFNKTFFKAYHEIIPKSEGFDKRNKLYQLFHYLNHWNHWGSGYRSSTISTFKELLKG